MATQPAAVIPTDEARLLPTGWKAWPVVPEISEGTRENLPAGNVTGPRRKGFFSDRPTATARRMYCLQDWLIRNSRGQLSMGAYLETIGTYSESWGRDFVTVKNGMSSASMLSPYWNDEERCEVDESPLACEIRLHNPSVIIISIGTNWLEEDYEPFEEYYRKAIEEIIAQGIVPVIAHQG